MWSLQGSYDARQSLSVNTSLAAPLLSRFDLLLVLRDTRDAEWDGEVCDHILSAQQLGSKGSSTDVGQVQSEPCRGALLASWVSR